MFNFAWSEIALIGIVGLVFIGPKDMPTAIRAVTDLLKKGRKLAGEFQTHVDDMVREADLGEARESFRELRGMNLRGQVMRALDNDGSLRRTLTDNPLSAVPAASSSAIPGTPESYGAEIHTTSGTPVSGEELLRRRNAPHYLPGMMPGAVPDFVERGIIEPDEGDDPAPGIIPPSTARRLRRLRAAPAPAFVPPGSLRPYSDPY